jgi:hypothetical protein
MKNRKGCESPAVEDLLLIEVTADMIAKLHLPEKWRQVFFRAGEEIVSPVANTGEVQIFSWRKRGRRPLALQCLSCGALSFIGGCKGCGDRKLGIGCRIGSNGIREYQLLCRGCDSKTGSVWTCSKCGFCNPYHLTLGRS